MLTLLAGDFINPLEIAVKFRAEVTRELFINVRGPILVVVSFYLVISMREILLVISQGANAGYQINKGYIDLSNTYVMGT